MMSFLRRIAMLACVPALVGCEAKRPSTPTSPAAATSVAVAAEPASSTTSEKPHEAPPSTIPNKRYTLPEAMHLPLRKYEVRFGATKQAPAVSHAFELPDIYERLLGGPDADESTQTFGYPSDSFVPTFTLGRASKADPELNFTPLKNAKITRGSRSGSRWILEVVVGKFATVSEAVMIVVTSQGYIRCRGYVDTTDQTPIGEWMLDRCASLVD